MTRIEWSPDGARLLSCVEGVVHVHELDGTSTILDGTELLDARWRGDAIVAIDARGMYCRYSEGTVELLNEPLRAVTHAAIAADADECITITRGTVAVDRIAGEQRWKLDPWKHRLDSWEDRTSAALSPDGRYIALGYEIRGEANFNYQRKEGRGFVVIDTVKDTVVDRSWLEVRRARAPIAFAFDGKGKRLAIAVPEAGVTTLGAIRLGKEEVYPRTHAGGARAVAIDRRGVLAAYAYAPQTDVPKRLRVDYLEHGAKGGAAISIVDTLWMDPEIDDALAIAFDRESRLVACVDANARVSIVPVL